MLQLTLHVSMFQEKLRIFCLGTCLCNLCLLVPSSKEVLQKVAAGHEEAFQRVLEEEDGGLQLLVLLLLLLDLGLQRVAEGLGPCAVEVEFRLVLLLLGFSHLDS